MNSKWTFESWPLDLIESNIPVLHRLSSEGWQNFSRNSISHHVISKSKLACRFPTTAIIKECQFLPSLDILCPKHFLHVMNPCPIFFKWLIVSCTSNYKILIMYLSHPRFLGFPHILWNLHQSVITETLVSLTDIKSHFRFTKTSLSHVRINFQRPNNLKIPAILWKLGWCMVPEILFVQISVNS